MKKFSLNTALFFLLLSNSGMVVQASDVPDYMKPFYQDMEKPASKENIALDQLYSLNDEMFSINEKSLSIYEKNFLDRTNLIMGLFSGKGGRFILYRAGQPP